MQTNLINKKTEVKKGRTTLLQPMMTKYPNTQFKPPVCFDAFYAGTVENASSNAYLAALFFKNIY
jgi:predicted RNA-binding protein with PIN domain